MGKRIISCLLILALLLSAGPVAVNASTREAGGEINATNSTSVPRQTSEQPWNGVIPVNTAFSDQEDVVRYTVLLLNTEPGYTIRHNGDVIYEVSTPIETVRAAATKFIAQMRKASGTNYVSIVSFSSEVVVDSEFSTNEDELIQALDGLQIGSGMSDINSAYLKAKELCEGIEASNAIINVILLHSLLHGMVITQQ